MSTLTNLSRRIEKLSSLLDPRPLLFDCTGARDELLSLLDASMTEEERATPYNPTPEEITEMEAFDSFLSDVIARDEQEYNVRFLSYDE